MDCDVYTLEDDGKPVRVHSRDWVQSDALEWVRRISFADCRKHEDLDKYLAKIASFVDIIYDGNGETSGRAAIAFGNIETGIGTVGGLVSGSHSRSISRFSTAFVGEIAYEPAGPRRDSGDLSSAAEVAAWASNQARRLSNADINALEKYPAAMHVAGFGGDPSPIAAILINRVPVTLVGVYDKLSAGEELFLVLNASELETPAIGMIVYRPDSCNGIGFGPDEVSFTVSVVEAWSGTRLADHLYHRIPTKDYPAPSCFLSCLERYVSDQGRRLRRESLEDVLFATYTGKASSRENLLPGAELRGPGIKLFLE